MQDVVRQSKILRVERHRRTHNRASSWRRPRQYSGDRYSRQVRFGIPLEAFQANSSSLSVAKSEGIEALFPST